MSSRHLVIEWIHNGPAACDLVMVYDIQGASDLVRPIHSEFRSALGSQSVIIITSGLSNGPRNQQIHHVMYGGEEFIEFGAGGARSCLRNDEPQSLCLLDLG